MTEKGWEFRAVYVSSPTDEIPPIAKPTPPQLQTMFGEAEVLTNSGHAGAAFVTLWAVLESLARLASSDAEARTSQGFSPLQAIQTLAEAGYIENEGADQLREMAKLRNAVVHGDFSINVTADQAAALLSQLQAIASDIMSETAA